MDIVTAHMPNNIMAGKGDRPRNCFSVNFKNNYDSINWSKNKLKKNIRKNLNKKDETRVTIPTKCFYPK